jgi:nicotinamide riboside transporter PnuC
MSLETVTGKIDGILWAVVLVISGILWAVAGFPLSAEVIVFGCIVIACVVIWWMVEKGHLS